MNLKRFVALSMGAVGLSALLFAGTQVAGSTDAVEAQTPARVTIENFAYSPNPVRVRVGDTVTWTNRGSVPHTATAKDGGFNTGIIEPGASGKRHFLAGG